jgi:sigma-B regulation protein RsbU (phosphoserine phosphatase)
MVQEYSAEEQISELKFNLEKTRWTLQDLATMGAMITSIRDMDTILSVVMEMSIRMVEGEVGLIQLHENGELVSKVNWGVDDSVIRRIIYKDNENIADYCFNKQAAVVIENFDRKNDSGPNITTLASLPIKSRAKCHGVIIIINKTTGGGFTEEDKDSLEMLANFAAVAIDNSILLKESLKKQKIEQELAIARQIQKTILPDGKVNIDGVEIGTAYFPAREIGGDFYDIIKVTDSHFLVVIGDVSNKGIPAALVMAATSAVIKAELKRSPQITPSDLVANLNNILCDGIIKTYDMFVTLFIARFDLNIKRLTYCNAGHTPPLFWMAARKKVQDLRTGGTFVGQFPRVDYELGEMTFEEGDSVFAFTDGLTEASNVRNELFGMERAKQVFIAGQDVSAGEFCVKVKEWVNRFVEGAGEESADDFTLLEIKILLKS